MLIDNITVVQKRVLMYATMLICALIIGCTSTNKSLKQEVSLSKLDTSELKMTMLANIANIIISDRQLPDQVKNDIATMALSPLREGIDIKIEGTDTTTRPIVVNFQKAFEQSIITMLEESHIIEAIAIIHTRLPTTPLCNPEAKSLNESMHPSMATDPVRRKTIEDRTITLRKMAKQGAAMNFYVAYVKDGLNQRSPQEKATFQREVSDPQNTSLHDSPLTLTEMPDEIVGASYILTTKRGNHLFFGNMGVQAKDAEGVSIWRLWFGSLKDTAINHRYKEIFNYLKAGGLNIYI
ncbi:MAG: hypothetical protein QS748_04555 [Candidatus Endonucleobacter bathymodioli]|uniref:Uncharacterized protein n=1 Tax=Candidatus Endonucleibacter bathymodioli TaxID=539814 RepID=A0AA90NSG0_9GAMM|nr:hypothetical protein [Candidatus Endonucleobacter bathymodioli]